MNPLFSSYVIGGFECSYLTTKFGKTYDQLAASRHDVLIRDDYELLRQIGISTVREGLAWSQIDKGLGRYDFTRFEVMMAVGQEMGVQQIWDLSHFDYPASLDPFSDDFIARFANYAQEAVRLIRKYQTGTLYIVPVNEISFFYHMGGSVGMWEPLLENKGYEFCQRLVRASIAAMDAIWEVESDVRFIQVDPVEHRRVRGLGTPEARAFVELFNERRFWAWDMLSGRMNPELGGDPRYLDILGLNYYPINQVYFDAGDWMDPIRRTYARFWDPDWLHLAEVIGPVYERYGRPMLISETGAWGDLRENWWKLILQQVDEAVAAGLPIVGLCPYPVVDREDWHEGHLTNSGLWDFRKGDGLCGRIPHNESIVQITEYARKHSAHNKVERKIVKPTR